MRRPNTPIVCAALAFAVLMASACDTAQQPPLEAGAGAPACLPDEVRPCRCADGTDSVAVCRADRTLTACACADAGAVAARDASPPRRDARPPRPRHDQGVVDAAGDDAPADAAGPGDARVDASLDAAPDLAPDAAPDRGPPDAAPVPTLCGTPPDLVRVGAVEVFRFEASHPAATDAAAFPGARSSGAAVPAPPGEPEACSVAGVRPWHSVTWSEADAACARIGWRLCGAAELARACGGPGEQPWTYGDRWEAGRCNVLGAWVAPGGDLSSEAPTGTFDGCRSAEGLFDLTGNLWEWVGDARAYQGAGWRTIAERFRPVDMLCDVQAAPADPQYRNPDVGFRCCRDAR
ncbi:MAG: SUMF1/EgtB/PvdO family nonheme iron enzyme [Myxococcales bacterium]|nr:SUMF1/EgtB/PvdO family nonheme iron enzyme [Myxococcales bacterium]